MRLRYAKARVAAWWRPTIHVPVAPASAEARLIVDALMDGRPLGVVTVRGVEVVVRGGCGWDLRAVSLLLDQIDRLPELAPGSWRVDPPTAKGFQW